MARGGGQRLTVMVVDGNLSGYHKKKYVCKVGSARTAA